MLLLLEIFTELIFRVMCGRRDYLPLFLNWTPPPKMFSIRMSLLSGPVGLSFPGCGPREVTDHRTPPASACGLWKAAEGARADLPGAVSPESLVSQCPSHTCFIIFPHYGSLADLG